MVLYRSIREPSCLRVIRRRRISDADAGGAAGRRIATPRLSRRSRIATARLSRRR
jgi:hypothetical protein